MTKPIHVGPWTTLRRLHNETAAPQGRVIIGGELGDRADRVCTVTDFGGMIRTKPMDEELKDGPNWDWVITTEVARRCEVDVRDRVDAALRSCGYILHDELFILRAEYREHIGSTYVFMNKDYWRNPETGSFYYWSNNQLIARRTTFATPTEAIKAYNRLGPRLKDAVHRVKAVPYQEGKQIFWTDGRTSP